MNRSEKVKLIAGFLSDGNTRVTKERKKNLLLALQSGKINFQKVYEFKGMDFYKTDELFVCEQDLQRYSYEEIEKIKDDISTIPGAIRMIEVIGMNNGQQFISKVHLLTVDKNEIFIIMDIEKNGRT